MTEGDTGTSREGGEPDTRGSHAPDVLPLAVGPVWLAIDASHAIEILGEARWIPVPSASALVPGVMAFRGRAVAVLDLGQVLPDVPRLERGTVRARTVVAETPAGAVAIPVDRVREVVSARDLEVRAARLVQGTAREVISEELCMALLDLHAVVAGLGREGENP